MHPPDTRDGADPLPLDEDGLPFVLPLFARTVAELRPQTAGWIQLALLPGSLVAVLTMAVIVGTSVFTSAVLLGPKAFVAKNAGAMFAIYEGAALVFVALVVIALIPLEVAIDRALAAWLEDGVPPPLGLRPALAAAMPRLGAVLALSIPSYAVLLTGFALCYVPGVAAWILLEFATTAVIVDGLSPVAAIRRSAAHAARYPLWRIGFGVLTLMISGLLSGVPLLGAGLAMILYGALRIRAYRMFWPRADGVLPA